MLRRITAAIAFIASASAYLVIMVAGVGLAAVEQSGARGLGVLLSLGGTGAFGAALFLVFASSARFRTGRAKLGAALATVCAILPPATLAGAAFAFSGIPRESRMPALDWSIFALGAAFSLGAMALGALGLVRIGAGTPPGIDRGITGADDQVQSGLI